MKKSYPKILCLAVCVVSPLSVASAWDKAFEQTQSARNRAESSLSQLPVQGRVSSQFGARERPVASATTEHNGVDIAAEHGTPIHAIDMGRVLFAGVQGSYGLVVKIQHLDGSVTKYAHASELFVTNGQRVHKGETIAAVGDTGLATGPHLHFEKLIDGHHVDPMKHAKYAVVPTSGLASQGRSKAASTEMQPVLAPKWPAFSAQAAPRGVTTPAWRNVLEYSGSAAARVEWLASGDELQRHLAIALREEMVRVKSDFYQLVLAQVKEANS